MTEHRWRRDGTPTGEHDPYTMVLKDGAVTDKWWRAHHQEINPTTWTYCYLFGKHGDPAEYRRPVGILHAKM